MHGDHRIAASAALRVRLVLEEQKGGGGTIRTFRHLVVTGVAYLFNCVAAAQSPQDLKITRDLRIDAAAHDLSPIEFLAVAPNGTIVVSQVQDGLLRYFDVRGRSLGTFGRKGQGPGEFQAIGVLGWIGDTLVVSDARTRRFTLISPERKLVRTVPWMTSITGPVTASSDPTSTSVTPFHLYADGSQLAVAVLRAETPVPGWLGAHAPGSLYLRAHANGMLRRVLGWLPSIVSCTTAPSRINGGEYLVMRIPFCQLPLHDVAMDGGSLSLAYFEAGNRETFRFSVISANGDTAFSRSLRFQRVSIPKAVRDSAIAALIGTHPAMRSVFEKVQIPDIYPPVLRVLGGRDGITLLEWYSQSGPLLWEAFDPKSRSIGRLTVPRNIQVRVASRDAIWATETDEEGLQHIVRFRVTR